MKEQIETARFKIYIPEDDEDVVVIEDVFDCKMTIDLDDFDNILQALHSVKEY